MKIRCLLGLLLISLAAASAEKPRIEIALLLDTSGSMDGLIDQAKSRLWTIVNDLARAKKRGQSPELRVALYEYGKSSLPKSEGYLQMLVPLTNDLDRVSEALFELTTNGGEEYCGRVIGEAAHSLDWRGGPGDYRAIFIAGNEPFDQGGVDFRKACGDAIARGIVVNTIFCGNEQEGIQTHWKEGADLADGRFLVINHNQELVSLEAPQDREILELGDRLNQTYLAFGSSGAKALKRQKKQDLNAITVSEETAVQRTLAKASVVYETESWDLVSAVEKKEADAVLDSAGDDLPASLKDMDREKQKAFLKEKAEDRKKIQDQLEKLQSERMRYLAKQSGEATLDSAMVEAIRRQMKKKAFEFKE